MCAHHSSLLVGAQSYRRGDWHIGRLEALPRVGVSTNCCQLAGAADSAIDAEPRLAIRSGPSTPKRHTEPGAERGGVAIRAQRLVVGASRGRLAPLHRRREMERLVSE